MIGLGFGALLAVWLVFSVLKKVVGLIFLLALAAGAYVLWTNPSLLHSLMATIQQRAG